MIIQDEMLRAAIARTLQIEETDIYYWDRE